MDAWLKIRKLNGQVYLNHEKGILILQKGKEMKRYMAEQDTIKLLWECDAGNIMGIAYMEYVLDYIHVDSFRKSLSNSKNSHEKLRKEIEALLDTYHEDGKEPTPVAKSMSWMKTSVKLIMNESDKTIAGLMTDGCNMGVKTLNGYLNQYTAADKKSKDIARRLIDIEEKLAADMRKYL